MMTVITRMLMKKKITREIIKEKRKTAFLKRFSVGKPKTFLTIECTSGPHTGESCVLEGSMIIGSRPKQNASSSSSDHRFFPISRESQAWDNHVKLILSCRGGKKEGILMVNVMDICICRSIADSGKKQGISG